MSELEARFDRAVNMAQNGAWSAALGEFQTIASGASGFGGGAKPDPIGENPALQYDLGLCFFRADKHADAIGFIEKAIESAKRLAAKAPRQNPLAITAACKEAIVVLRAKEIGGGSHLGAMDRLTPIERPKQAIETMTMTLALAHKALGDAAKAKQIASALVGSEFDEFKSRIGQ